MITTAAHEINRAARRTSSPRPTRSATSSSSTGRRPSGRWRRWSRSSPSGRRSASGVDPIRDVQVLAPMYRGAVGIDALNERLRARAQPRRRAGPQRPLPGRRPPDPDPQLARAGADERLDRLPPRRRSRTRRRSSSTPTRAARSSSPTRRPATLRLAYAISVHKAQGCEVPVVVAVCHRSHARMLTRPLLYTAITRARDGCVLVGDPAALAVRGRGATTAAAATPAWPSACAAATCGPARPWQPSRLPWRRSASPWPGSRLLAA